MKIAVVYQYYQDHRAPGHSLIYDLTQYLALKGHDVTVIAAETGYMKHDLPVLPWYRRIIRREQLGQVKVIRTYAFPEYHRNYIARLLSFLSFSLSCPLGLFAMEKPDLVLASSPPIFPMFSAWLVCKLRRIPLVLEVRDLWPVTAVQMGILNNKFLIYIMTWMEKFLYNQAIRIVVLTEGIRDNISERGWSDKVTLVTCGVDFDKLYPDAEGGALIRNKHQWDDKKIVMYFGALGEANNLSVILRTAQRFQGCTEVLFVLVGDGLKRKEIEDKVIEMGLKNVLVLPAVPKYYARLYINAADLCLVTLQDAPVFSGAIPTKLIDYMACGKPVLCGIRGEAKRIVEKSGAGLAFEPNDDMALKVLIEKLLSENEKLSQMKICGLEFVQKHFSASMTRQLMESLLIEVAINYADKNIVEDSTL